ncbi:MAG: amylo-alpha-1,6-glucosidase [Hyphomicrobiales bacterium]
MPPRKGTPSATKTTRRKSARPKAVVAPVLETPIPSLAPLPALESEWLEPDGLGGFASGTVSGIRNRRYHALLLAATTPPTGRVVLVNGLETRITTPHGAYDLSAQRYAPDVIHPDGMNRIESFTIDPWPRWVFRLEDGTRVEQQLFSVRGIPGSVVSWNIVEGSANGVHLSVRPLVSGRDAHALHHENAAIRPDATVCDCCVHWRPYDTLPSIVAVSSGSYMHHPFWYRNFVYVDERSRGLDDHEDLWSPGAFHFDLSHGEAVFLVTTEDGYNQLLELDATRSAGLPAFLHHDGECDPLTAIRSLRDLEREHRAAFKTPLDLAAEGYLVRRGEGLSIVAGYPWFTDWGRDTFVAMRGLCLASKRLDEAKRILVAWAGAVSEGMLPNRFSEANDHPEYNAVDASLWYVVAVHEFLEATAQARRRLAAADRKALETAVEEIVAGYAAGTRYGIRMDDDGLLAAGVPGAQLTWMDAKVGDWVVTPRIGKPVEVQALWLNALRIASGFSPRWAEAYARGLAAFAARFWNEETDALYDVVDVDHVRGTADARIRPNQIFAVGGLPHPVLEGDRARLVVDAVESKLLTPIGLRTLAPGEPGYAPRYQGDVRTRDGAYHQGTVWPWLIGPFVEAWVRVRGGTPEAKREARERFLIPLFHHLGEAGLGHVSELADGDAPHTPRGCPFQAWSLGEVLRLDRKVLV